MTHYRLLITVAIMLIITATYTLFVTLSSNIVFILVEPMEVSPGVLFSATVKPYIMWIIIAWISFFTLSYVCFKKSDGDSRSYEILNSSAILHGLWIGAATLWHLSGLISPFISKSYIIN